MGGEPPRAIKHPAVIGLEYYFFLNTPDSIFICRADRIHSDLTDLFLLSQHDEVFLNFSSAAVSQEALKIWLPQTKRVWSLPQVNPNRQIIQEVARSCTIHSLKEVSHGVGSVAAFA
jgi:hypothetical protein